MKNGLVIADAGPIFSLAILNQLEVLDQLFDEIKIANAVWNEITLIKTTEFYNTIEKYFKTKVSKINGFNELTIVMDYGESESVMLYKELKADFLLIDDKKARDIAENLDVRCIGTLGILSSAKNKGMIEELRPLFIRLLDHNRYYSLKLLNTVLEINNETLITKA